MAYVSGGVGLTPVKPSSSAVPRVVSITREPTSVVPGLRIANPPAAHPPVVHPAVHPASRPPAAPGTRITNDPNAAAPTTSYPSPYDATYYGALNTATFNANNRINQSNLQSGYAATDLQNKLGSLSYNQGLATTRDQNAENARGGFALGHLGQTLGQLNHQYLDTQAADQSAYQRGEDARSAARAALQGGLSLTQAALAAAAVERASTAAAKNPTIGLSSAPLTTPAGTPAPTPARAPVRTLAKAPTKAPAKAPARAKPMVFRPGTRIANPPGAARGSGGVAI